jgi:hypothetical protein
MSGLERLLLAGSILMIQKALGGMKWLGDR